MRNRRHQSRERGRADHGRRTGLARALSKLGFCSRRQAWALIAAGRARVNGAVERDPERRVDARRDRIEVDEQPVRVEAKVYLMLNKPRGLVTTTSDEQGRATVFACFNVFGGASRADSPHHTPSPPGAERAPGSLPRTFPVGRLDKASEGLLLFTNDTAWAARITDPRGHLDKTYHVQVDCVADDALIQRLRNGLAVDGDFLTAKGARVLRGGTRNSWLEVVLDEGKNRHLRRLFAALGIHVLRLVRVAIGLLQLGALAKGQWRHLTSEEVFALTPPHDNGSRRTS